MKPTYFTAPNPKRLVEALGITKEKADMVRLLIQGGTPTYDAVHFPRSNLHFNRCHHPLPRIDRILICLDELLDGFGVECLRDNTGQQMDGSDIVAEYINVGDTYDSTLLFNHRTQAFSLTSWGDFVERNHRRYSL